MHGHCVLESEGVAGVEDWLGFGIDGPAEKQDVRRADGDDGG